MLLLVLSVLYGTGPRGHTGTFLPLQTSRRILYGIVCMTLAVKVLSLQSNNKIHF